MADSAEPSLSSVPLSPGAAFAQGAAASLAPVSEDLDAVHERIRTGQLRLDEEAAHRLLASLAAMQARVHTLIADGKEQIGRPLRFGDNFVGEAMSERLRGAAFGTADAAIPVLEQFSGQLEKLESIVRRAAGLTTEFDLETRDRLRSIGEGE